MLRPALAISSNALTAAPQGDHHPRVRGRLRSANPAVGVAAMVKNLVAGCVLVALIFMALLAYAQEHHECLNGHLIVRGHLIKGLRSCGSVSPSM